MRLTNNTIKLGNGDSANEAKLEIDIGLGTNNPSIGFDPSSDGLVVTQDHRATRSMTSNLPIASVIHVSSTGDDGTAQIGSQNLPFKTFQAAVNQALRQAAQKWILIGYAGNYDEIIDLKTANSFDGHQFNFWFMPGCSIIYTGNQERAVIGKYAATMTYEEVEVHIYGFGHIEHQGAGSAIGNKNIIDGKTMLTNTFVHSAHIIQSQGSFAIGEEKVAQVANVHLIKSASSDAIRCFNTDKIQIMNCPNIIGKSNGIMVGEAQSALIQNSFIRGIDEFAVSGINVSNQFSIERCRLDGNTGAILSQESYALEVVDCSLIQARAGHAIRVGDRINRKETRQVRILRNFIYCNDPSKEMCIAGTGQHVEAVISFNQSNTSFRTGDGPGLFRNWGGNNQINNNIQL